ncbi:MAG: choice-of-anchor M domain-containing protein [Opitutales bacterium]|nr:choice-of-anchor M domain-containing protein [Opitutales bacterium]
MFRVSMQQSFGLAAVVLALTWASPASGKRVLWAGHFDLGAHFDPETGWHSYVWDFDEERALATESTLLWVGPAYWREIDSPILAPLANVGEAVWVLPATLPEHLSWDEFLYLGLGTQRQQPGIFRGGAGGRGEKTMRLVSVEGSGPANGGHFAMWYTEGLGRVIWIFNTRDGIGESDRFEGLRAGFHGHYNTAFTQPGRYEVTVEFSGDLRDAHGGGQTAHRATWIFYVSDSEVDWSREFTLASGWVFTPETGWMYPLGDDLYYRPHRGFWKFSDASREAAFVYDPRWQQWIYRSQAWYPWAFDMEAGWVYEIRPDARHRFFPGNGWVLEQVE